MQKYEKLEKIGEGMYVAEKYNVIYLFIYRTFADGATVIFIEICTRLLFVKRHKFLYCSCVIQTLFLHNFT